MTTRRHPDPERSEGEGSAVVAKYIAFARLGFRQARAEPGEVLGRALLLVLIFGVFSAIWRAVMESDASARDPNEMLWYLAITEWVVMAAPPVFMQMEEDIRRGDVAYEIARPASWLGARFAHGLGALAMRAPVLLLIALGGAWLFVGPPARPVGLAVAIAFGFVAAVILTLFHVALGVVAFWLGDVAPAYWIWQKMLFVLGGMLLPLQFYPDLFVTIARLTPFPAFLAGPASLATGEPLMHAGVLALTLAFWALAGWMIAGALFSRAVRRLHVNGG